MPNWLSSILKERGGVSTMRLTFLVWFTGVILAWFVACYFQKTLIDIPSNIMNLSLGFLGGKVVQRWVEGKQTETTIEPNNLLEAKK